MALAAILPLAIVCAQGTGPNYKHPYLNASGEVLDDKDAIVGTVSKDGIVKNGKGEVIGYIKGNDVTEASGKKIGWMGKNGTFYDDKGAIVFTVDEKSKGERCKIYDPDGKVIAEVHESYKNQACAIHCLFRMKDMKP